MCQKGILMKVAFLAPLIVGIVLTSNSVQAHMLHEVHVMAEAHELYPIIEPYRTTYISVSPIHTLYYAEFGNPDGVPVLVVHGGPGAGCSQEWSAFFDPAFYRVIMLDQRGAAKSTPAGEMIDNTPMHLVADMELLRTELGIDQWILFGGSWGSALSLLYAEHYPERIGGMVLRGIFLARKVDYEHLFYGMKQFYPEAWDDFIDTIGASEDTDLITLLHEQLMGSDQSISLRAAHAFMRFDTICGSLLPSPMSIEEQASDDHSALCIARAFVHYGAHGFFMEENQLLRNIDVIQHIPTIIVQGRYDMICPIQTAYTLYKKLPKAALWVVPDAGHFATEPSLGSTLCYAMEVMKSFSKKCL